MVDMTVTIQKGDTLWDIAERELGDGSRWKEIQTANNIKNVKRIKPGQKITIPGKKATASSYTPFEQDDAPFGLRYRPRPSAEAPPIPPVAPGEAEALAEQVRGISLAGLSGIGRPNPNFPTGLDPYSAQTRSMNQAVAESGRAKEAQRAAKALPTLNAPMYENRNYVPPGRNEPVGPVAPMDQRTIGTQTLNKIFPLEDFGGGPDYSTKDQSQIGQEKDYNFPYVDADLTMGKGNNQRPVGDEDTRQRIIQLLSMIRSQ